LIVASLFFWYAHVGQRANDSPCRRSNRRSTQHRRQDTTRDSWPKARNQERRYRAQYAAKRATANHSAGYIRSLTTGCPLTLTASHKPDLLISKPGAMKRF